MPQAAATVRDGGPARGPPEPGTTVRPDPDPARVVGGRVRRPLVTRTNTGIYTGITVYTVIPSYDGICWHAMEVTVYDSI